MRDQNSESGVIFLLLAVIAALVVVTFAFARAYQAHQNAGTSASPSPTLYKQ